MADDRQRLLDAIARLDAAGLRSLADYADFLAARGQMPVSRETVPAPVAQEKPVANPLPRPEKESVVAAIKRLSASYPMLDKTKMLNHTSTLMTQHVMGGRDTVEIIDELEAVFIKQYRVWRGDEAEEK